MISFDRIPPFLLYEEDFDGEELKSTASKEAILAYVNEKINCLSDETILLDNKKLSEFAIQKFKETNCYHSKTEDERKKIIKYIRDNAFQERILFDKDGRKYIIY